MQERTADVFIAATANALKSLPPELLRRFDAKFWVSLPDDTQRKEILSIHLKKVDRSIDMFTDHIPALVEACDGFSGAEIETWVGESLVHAFHAQHEDLQIDDLLETATSIAPMSVISSEDLIESRRWAMSHGIRSASITHMEPSTAPARAMRRRVISQ